MYNIKINQVFESLNSSSQGISESEATKRLELNGKNAIPEGKKTNNFVKFLLQFTDVIILVLLGAFLLSVILAIVENDMEELIDAGIILLVVVVNAIIGYIQEEKADKAMENLKDLSKPLCKVMRNGKIKKIKCENLVVGDVVLLEAGDLVPADLRLFNISSLKIEESSLTGESIAVEKNVALIEKENVALGDRFNMAFMGSTVTYGRGYGVVIATGIKTEMGKIAKVLTNGKKETTPITRRVQKTNKYITIFVLIMGAIIFGIGILDNSTSISSAFMIAIAIAVCVIPEGLPASITVAMAIGVERMSKKNAIIRKLPAVETLGSTEVICSDKTGTLTLNQMTVTETYTFNKKDKLPNNKSQKNLQSTTPQLTENSTIINTQAPELKNTNLDKLISCMLLCNDTISKYENNTLSTMGDPTETALVHYGYSLGFSKDNYDGKYPRIDEIPFDSNRKLMTTIHSTENGKIAYVKGGIDKLLPLCTYILDESGNIKPITEEDKLKIYEANKKFSLQALRVLSFAYKLLDNNYGKATVENIEKDLIFIGLCGMIDPPRKEVEDSIKKCKQAGIITMMITGDHKDTAFAIAQKLGIADRIEQVITGVELDNLPTENFANTITKYRVFARVSPEHKMKIVKALQSLDKIVAMTGDGVNDAPSIKTANIGIGMGITGTDVTKNVADVVLADDNFATIVDAVEEGRKVYNNILKIIKFLISTSIAEAILLITIMIILKQSFFTPALILWINFVSDTLASLALGAEKSEPDIMKQKPIKNRGSLLSGETGFSIIYNAIFASLINFGIYFTCLYALNMPHADTITMCFLTLVMTELFHAYNLRATRVSIFKMGVFNNKYMNYAFLLSMTLTALTVLLPLGVVHTVLGITQISIVEWLISIAFALIIIPANEVYKLFLNRKSKKNINIGS